MSHYQLVVYQGNLGQDPEMRFTPSGKAVCNFSVGSTVSWKDANGEKKSQTTWLKITAWGKLAEIVNQYAKKGSPVLVEGTLKPDPTTGRPVIFETNAGKASANFEITATKVQILPSGKNGEETAHVATSDDDIPF